MLKGNDDDGDDKDTGLIRYVADLYITSGFQKRCQHKCSHGNITVDTALKNIIITQQKIYDNVVFQINGNKCSVRLAK